MGGSRKGGGGVLRFYLVGEKETGRVRAVDMIERYL